jgi:hypothetical protein
MVAITVVTIAVTALVAISNAAINSVNSSRSQAIADQYARQALEATRVNRDQQGWNTFVSGMNTGDYKVYSLNGTVMTYQQALSGSQITSTTYLCSIANVPSSPYLVQGTTSFFRLITLWKKDTSSVQVTATLCYDYRGGANKKLEVQTLLTNWQ